MRNIFIIFLVILMNSSLTMNGLGQTLPFNSHAYQHLHQQALSPFINALKTGNIDVIKRFLSKELLSEYDDLFEKNAGYSKFLKEYYRDLDFQLRKAEVIDNNVNIEVEIIFLDGSRTITNITFIQKGDGWKVKNLGKKTG